jgi:hypothetical protein
MKLEWEELEKYLPFVIILVTAFVLWWCPGFLGSGYICVGDTPFPLSGYAVQQSLQSQYYLWNSQGLGFVNFYNGIMPYFLFIFVLWESNLPLYLINRLVFVLPSIIAGWSTYYLASAFVKGKYSRTACTISSLFAVLTPAQVFQNPQYAFSLAGTPLLLALFIRGLMEEKRKDIYALLIPLSSILVALGYPILIVLDLGVLVLYFIMHVILLKKFSIADLKFVLLAVGLTVLVNFFWFYPFLVVSTHYNILGIAYSNPTQRGGIGIVESYAPYSSLLYVSRLILNLNNGISYYFSVSPILIILSFLLPAYVFLSIVVCKKPQALAFGVIALLLTLFSTGTHYPAFASVYKWLWSHIFFFQVLNSPFYFQYVLTFFYAVMIGLTTQTLMLKLQMIKLGAKFKGLSKRFGNPFGRIFTPKLVVVGLALAIVFANGGMALNVLGNRNYTINYARTMPPMTIPDNYYRLLDYLEDSNSTGFRLLVLPFQTYVTYDWYPYGYNLIASGVLSDFSPLPIIGVGLQTAPVVEAMEGNLSSGTIRTAASLMGSLSIKYMLVSKDLLSNYYQDAYALDPSHYLVLLDQAPDIFVPVMNTSEFTVYELNSAFLMPSIFLANNSQPSFTNTNIPVFDGKSIYVAINASTSLSLTNSGSIFAWIYLKEANPSGQVAISPTITCFGPNNAWRLYVDGATHHLSAAWFDGKPIDSNYSITYENWYFVGLTVSESLVTIYVNGQQVFCKTYSNNTYAEGLTLRIGYDGTTSFFDGYITNVQIYGTALSPTQVVSLFEKGIDGSPVADEGLAGWWLLQQVESQALDLSGNNNTGTIIGNVTWANIVTDVNFGEISPVVSKDISPTEYVIYMNSTSPSYLILNEQFDENWIAYANGKQLPSHLMFNDYANAWFINKTGSLAIELQYSPESTVMPAYLITVLGLFAISACVLCFYFFKRRARAS